MIPEINKIVKSINREVSDINCGGCSVFAESLFPYLESLGLKPQIKVLDYTNEDLAIPRKNIENKLSLSAWHGKGVFFIHIVIKFVYRKRVYIVDSTGVLGFHLYSLSLTSDFRGGCFSYDEIRSFSETADGWNSWFDRDYIGKIKTDLKTGFNTFFKDQFILFSDKAYS